MEPAATPSFTVVIPTLDAEEQLAGCLRAISAQDYPRELVEILVCDGGSSDGTRSLAEGAGARVVHNAQRLAEPGVKLGLRLAKGDVAVVMAADNELVSRDWFTRFADAFRDPGVIAGYTHVVNTPQDRSFCRYFNYLHADPFNWFVYGPRAHPGRFADVYPVREERGGYQVLDLAAGEPPLLALAQGFAVRPEVLRLEAAERDDILPILNIIQSGGKLAYVDTGIGHHTVTSFRNFIGKYRRRTALNYSLQDSGFPARRSLLGRRQKIRQYLWFPYALCGLLPLVDAIRGVRRDRDLAWLFHPIACAALAAAMLDAVARVELRRVRGGP